MSEGIKFLQGEFPAVPAKQDAWKVERITRAMRFIQSASANAGLDGRLQVCDRCHDGRFVAMVDEGSIADAARHLSAISEDHLQMVFIPSGGGEKRFSEFRAIIGDQVLNGDSYGLPQELAERISEHLTKIGFLSIVRPVKSDDDEEDNETGYNGSWDDGDADGDSEYEAASRPTRRQPRKKPAPKFIVEFCVVLDKPISCRSPEFTALCSLADFGGDTAAVCHEGVAELILIIGNEDAEALAKRAALPVEGLTKLADRWEKVGRNINLFRRLTDQSREDHPRVQFVVPGYIPRGMITLLVGQSKIGKSTVSHELAIRAALDGEQSWLGLPVLVAPDEFVAYIAAEDDRATLSVRAASFDPERKAEHIIVFPKDEIFGQSIDAILDELRSIQKLALVIVDPALRFVDDENDAKATDRFMAPLDRFAAEKNCAVVVVHHIGKEGKRGAPRSIEAVCRMARGSVVFRDRPRVHIGMLRRGEDTIIGVDSHNLPPSCGMQEGERRFRRDPVSLSHVPVVERDTGGTSREGVDLEAVMTAARSVLDRGARLTRTGKHGLYGHNCPEVAGVSREKLHAAVQALIEQGRLALVDGRIEMPGEQA